MSRALLAHRLQAKAAPADAISRRPDGRPTPLSHAQERLWFLEQLEPGGAAYNIARAFACRGRLDTGALGASLTEVATRHETLRTTFSMVAEGPVQVVTPPSPVPLPMMDLADLPAAARRTELDRLAAAEAALPFDLARGPLLRSSLVRLGTEDHLLLLTLHHIVADGWSMSLLFRELGALYAAFVAGRPSPLPELSIQYADYSIWQRERLRGEALARLLAYWRRQLAGAPAVLELPLDRPRPAAQTFRGSRLAARLPGPLASAVNDLSAREGATTFMTFLAGFAALLGRWSGQDDVVVGSPIAGRVRSELEPLIGFFVNTLALRADLAGGTVRELLQRVRHVCLDAYAHQELPFEKLVEELSPARSLAWSPLFQVTFALQNAPTAALALPKLTIERLDVVREQVKFDLSLDAFEVAAGLELELWFNTDLFDATTIERLLGHFRTLLEGAVAEPSRRLSELPLLTAGEREQLLVEWTATAASFPRGLCLHELVKDQAGRTPEAVALVAGGERLTYRELDERAGRLAAHLRSLGVGPEVLVAVCTERDAAMVVGMLATLAAGGAYVPLDPTYPAERLAFTLADAEAKVLLTRSDLVERLPEHGAHVVCLDEWEGVAPPAASVIPSASEGSPATPANLAYVIYTSGSTGRPKGVAITHASAVTFLHWARTAFTPEELRGVFAGTSITFDLSVFELFGTLAWGGTVILGENALALAGHPAAAAVTLVNTVPSAIAELVRAGAVPGRVRTLNLAGEPLRRALVDRIHELGTVERVLNLYGPSEDTTYSTWALAERGSPAEPTIGRPIANTRAYVVDRSMSLQPVGVPGELWLTGEGLARGYLQRPELTAERFVPDPFGGEPGARAYRTGDLARWRPSGELEYLGRIDHQVKVRGFRIELGEVETALGAVPGVRETVVVAREDVPGERRLVAYVVPQQGREPAARELRSALAARLPEFMVPAAFVALPALPLTPNGKIDRKALPAPEAPAAADGAEPRTWIEGLVAGIWADVLSLDRAIGREDSFFELGGHSLAATRVASRVRDLFGVEMPLRKLFEAQTVAALAAWIESERRAGPGLAWPAPTAGAAVGSQEVELPTSWAQERIWLLDQLDREAAIFNMLQSIELVGSLDAAALERSLATIVERHAVLRTAFPDRQGQPVQVIEPAVELRLPQIDLAALPDQRRRPELERLRREEPRRLFDLERAPLLRPRLIRIAAREQVLLVCLHHIVFDGWSLSVLLRELKTLYRSGVQGAAAALPPLPIQYADYAVWQRQWFQGRVLEDQLAYWRQRLADPTVQDLQTDRPRGEAQTYRGSQRVQRFSPELSGRLVTLGHREGTTLFMTLLAALEVLLHRHTGETDLLVGTPVAGRLRSEAEGLIGVFLNTLVLRTDLGGDPPLCELLRRVRETALEAYAHQDLPFEKVLAELQPQRDASRTPYFQVFFNLLNFPERTVALPNLEMRLLRRPEVSAKFDLGLYVRERPTGLEIDWVYNADLFDAATVLRLERQYGELLSSMIDRVGERLSRLPLLPACEVQQLLVEWNDSATGPSPDGLIHEAFERQARRSPSRPALLWDGETVDYGALDQRANRLADELRGRGVGAESLVALCLERSPELVVAVLAVLKAGAAFLPLDPGNPAPRLDALMADASVALLLTTEQHLLRLPAWRSTALCMDQEPPPGAGRSATDAAPLATADNLAYVIFTSGSTGQPKGVMISHRTLGRRLAWMQEVYRLGEGDRVLHKASTGFDVAVWEILWPLRVGATVVVARPGGHQDAAYLVRLISEERVDLVHFVPSMLDLFLAEPRLAECDSLRVVLSGGEALSAELLERCRQRLPGHLYNQYGMTEACIDVTYCSTRDEMPAAGPVPIGRPYGDTAVHLLDRRLRPVPIGAVGDVWVGGDDGLLRGYRGSPDRTALALAPDPFSDMPGCRLYRTGDRARRRPDGILVYLGRSDNQIKLRGLRVAPEEIEGALRQHSLVAQATVVERDQRLVAYVRPVSSQAPTPEALRQHLRSLLPEQMTPSVYVMVDDFPRTPSGKLDRLSLRRRELPRGEASGDPDGDGHAGLSTPFEALLAEIWAQVLGLDRIGVDDNFFELGGHSLFAAQVVARLRQRHGVKLPLRFVFQTPTLAELALEVERRLRDGGAMDEVAPIAAAAEVSGPVPLTLAQKPFWLDRHTTAAPSTVPVIFTLEGTLDVAALRRSLQRIVDRHSILRTTFAEHDGEPVQVVHPSLPVGLAVIGLEAVPAEARRALQEELIPHLLRQPWDLVRAPLFRALLLRLGEGEHVFAFLCHHILLDGWSSAIFMRELEASYQGFAAGRAAALPDPSLQYRDFALWQHRYLRGETARVHQDYWRGQLRELAAEPTCFPLDRPVPAHPTLCSATLTLEVSPDLLKQVRELAAREGKTLFMVILAAINAVLFRHTGRQDLTVMSPYANRHLAEVEDLIGNFYTFLPLRTRLSPDQGFRELLATVQEATLGAYTHSDAIPEEILRRMWARRKDGEAPISRVLFALQNLSGMNRDFAGLKVRMSPMDSRRIRFDTSFFFYEGPGNLLVRLRYSTELFDEASLTRWYDDFLQVLRSAVKEPSAPLASLLAAEQ